MKQIFQDRTLLIVAHRLDVVSSLDYVCVLQSGECIEFGCPVDLLKSQQGAFYELWKASLGV